MQGRGSVGRPTGSLRSQRHPHARWRGQEFEKCADESYAERSRNDHCRQWTAQDERWGEGTRADTADIPNSLTRMPHPHTSHTSNSRAAIQRRTQKWDRAQRREQAKCADVMTTRSNEHSACDRAVQVPRGQFPVACSCAPLAAVAPLWAEATCARDGVGTSQGFDAGIIETAWLVNSGFLLLMHSVGRARSRGSRHRRVRARSARASGASARTTCGWCAGDAPAPARAREWAGGLASALAACMRAARVAAQHAHGRNVKVSPPLLMRSVHPTSEAVSGPHFVDWLWS